MTFSLKTLWILAALLWSAGAMAENQWLVGGGLAVAPDPFLNHSARVVPMPMVQYHGNRLHMEMGRFRYALAKRSNWFVFSQAAIRFEGFDPEDRDMEGMEERKPTLEGGLAFVKAGLWGMVEAGFNYDLAGVHKGYSFDARYELTAGAATWLWIPYVGVTHRSRRLVDYYYGVDSGEVRHGRHAYRGEASLNAYIGGQTLYKLRTRLWGLIGLHVERLGSAIQNSPIVDKTYQLSGKVGLIYEL